MVVGVSRDVTSRTDSWLQRLQERKTSQSHLHAKWKQILSALVEQLAKAIVRTTRRTPHERIESAIFCTHRSPVRSKNFRGASVELRRIEHFEVLE